MNNNTNNRSFLSICRQNPNNYNRNMNTHFDNIQILANIIQIQKIVRKSKQ